MRRTDNYKIQKLINEFNQNGSDVSKQKAKYYTRRNTINIKNATIIPIVEGIKLNKGNDVDEYHVFKYRIENMQETMIPFIFPKVYFYTNNDINFDTLSTSARYSTYWKYIAEDVYEFQIMTTFIASDDNSVSYDIYCDAYLFVLNGQSINDSQNNKS